MNIYDIAKKAGVSAATVSRVINNSDSVSERSKKKVKAIMEQEGYIPNVFARGLILNSVKTIGILCPVISDINHAAPVSHIEHLLRQNGFDTLLACASNYDEDKGKYLDLLLNKRVDAIVTIGATMKELADSSHFAAAARHVPILVVNGYIKGENIYSVLCDEYGAARECVGLLGKAGCKSIAYVYDTETYSGNQKLTGYRRGLGDCGLSPNPRLELRVCTEVNAITAADDAMTRLLASGVRPDALMAADDIVAVGALKALLRRKLDIPIIGFNNSRFAQCSNPELTSVDNMMETLCSTAINQLMEVLKGKSVPDKVVLSAKIIERDTFRFSER